jgi:hypothetical protein
VILRSLDKTLIAQPLSVEPTSESVMNIFGAKWAYSGLRAAFSTGRVGLDLERCFNLT